MNMTARQKLKSFGSMEFVLQISGSIRELLTRTSIRSSNSKPTIASSAGSLAVEAAEEVKNRFLQELPPSLLAEASFRDEENAVAPFKREEIILGPRLGSGEFSHVYEVQSFDLQPQAQAGSKKSTEELNKRLHMKHIEKYRQTNNARYALKHLKENYLKKRGVEEYVQAVSDLAMEAQFLASIGHPNIIKLRGITYSGASGFADGPTGYFLIIDRLQETLDQRIQRWRDLNKDCNATSKKGKRVPKLLRGSMNALPMSFTSKSTGGSEGIEVEVVDKSVKQSPKEVMDERLSVALQISAAMMYLHSNSIIFRDLKPANIGFDVRGDVKLFDFGLARAMPEGGNNYSDFYEMSGAGSPRYMAPECLNSEEYNLKADVYTFSIVVWEMLSCEEPYSHIKTRKKLLNDVVIERIRPAIEDSWPVKIQGMLESSFMADTARRPKMKLWYSTIRDVLADLRGGCKRQLSHAHIHRRRTQGSMMDLMKGVDKESFYSELRRINQRKSTPW